MTRKHFQAVADTIRAIPSPAKRKEQAEYHAKIFAKSNPRFDRARFFTACGLS